MEMIFNFVMTGVLAVISVGAIVYGCIKDDESPMMIITGNLGFGMSVFLFILLMLTRQS